MKKRNLLLTVSALGLVLLSGFAAFYPGGAPAGTTGSPGDAKNCTQCHGGTAATAAGWITSTIPVGGYVPGMTYQITATNSLGGSGNYGFEVSPQNAAGTLLGILAAGTNSQLVGSGKYVTHTNSSATKAWTFPWTAPARGTGNVIFYGAFARAYPGPTTLSTLTVPEMMNTGISAPTHSTALISPNPGNGHFTITIPESMRSGDGTLRILSASGKSVYATKYASKNNSNVVLDLSNLPKGLYIMTLQNASGNRSDKFILK